MLFLKSESLKEEVEMMQMERYDQMMDAVGIFVLDGTLSEPIYTNTQGFMPMFDHIVQKVFS